MVYIILTENVIGIKKLQNVGSKMTKNGYSKNKIKKSVYTSTNFYYIINDYERF